MWTYEKRLLYPVNIKNRDLRMAKLILDTLGGASGELSASMEYLQQRYTMPTGEAIALLTDIGTEELGHLEILNAMVYQLTHGATKEEIEAAGFDTNYVETGGGIPLVNPDGVPWTSTYIATIGDPIAAMTANMAAEERARAGYDQVLYLATDPEVIKPLKYLREREVVHFQRFGEMLNKLNGLQS